jgi:proline dehydrogenase
LPFLRRLLIKASDSRVLRRQVTSRKLSRRVALKFVAGETIDDGFAVARRLAAQGKTITLDYLGESVSNEADARSAAKTIVEMVDRIGREGLPAGVSVKPTQFGLHIAPGLARELVGDIAVATERIGQHLTLDMEGHEVTEDTIALVEELIADGHTHVGCAVQSYLRRTREDVERLSNIEASLRLCKGAYDEPATIAYRERAEVDISYAECATYLLEFGFYPRIATHDDKLIEFVKRTARRLGRTPDDFEFQMLYGVRPSLQDQLVRDGYRMCVYVPFGDQWFPYFMRRLAERPANLAFFLRALRDT